ncbi:hypothetical protein LguiA_011069 [Lonicera macranthoides]
MPDLGNLLNSSTLTLTHCADLKSADEECPTSVETLEAVLRDENLLVNEGEVGDRNGNLRRCRGSNKLAGSKNLDDFVKDWVAKKVELGVSEDKCFLPFLVGAPKLADCRACQKVIYPGSEVLCSVRSCDGAYHLTCAKERLGFTSSKKFKCPQHACFLCKQKFNLWKCVSCELASHEKCTPFPEYVVQLHNRPGQAICWRHPTDWHMEKKKRAVPTSDIEEIFHGLPVPYVEEEFKIDTSWKDIVENKLEPTAYKHIRRNIYLVKKKREHVNTDIGCTSCSSNNTCSEDCVCRVQCISCSKACYCSEMCTNRPFRKDKKIKIVKTQLCGWGAVAAESIIKGDFVIEYIGEVINDALCEQRLWDMKHKGITNFYMCEIRKDFTIDATFKGNASRFLNHSCDPNCNLEKWQVEGETRVGVFAARSIKVGEPLTYDYRFVQFGPEVKCHCGARNCQGYLGTKRKAAKAHLSWGSKRRRTSTTTLAIISQ